MAKHQFPYTTTIEIDCDPFTGMGRQGDHFKNIWINILGRSEETLPKRDSAFFGCWTYTVTYDTEDQQKAVGEFLTSLYNSGLCRYASW